MGENECPAQRSSSNDLRVMEAINMIPVIIL